MFRGVLIPVITPFHEDSTVDESILRQLVDFYVSASIQGLFALGSSGQGPAMSADERKATAEVIIDQAGGRTPVIIHVGTADTPTTVELAKHAAEAGADAIGVIPPYYYCDAPQSAILEHFKAVSDAAPLPIFIYENPKYCGISISPEFGVILKREVPAIRGMKVAYGAGAMADYVKLFPDDVSVFTGNADIFGLAPFGVAGMINPPTSSVPELCVALYQALEVPVVPVALNSGRFWGRRAFLKHPGVITIEYLDPIPPGLDRKAFLRQLEHRIETATRRLEAAAEADNFRACRN